MNLVADRWRPGRSARAAPTRQFVRGVHRPTGSCGLQQHIGGRVGGERRLKRGEIKAPSGRVAGQGHSRSRVPASATQSKNGGYTGGLIATASPGRVSTRSSSTTPTPTSVTAVTDAGSRSSSIGWKRTRRGPGPGQARPSRTPHRTARRPRARRPRSVRRGRSPFQPPSTAAHRLDTSATSHYAAA